MENMKFNFSSNKTGKQNAFSLFFIPEVVMLLWALFIAFNCVRNSNTFLLVSFLIVFFVAMRFYWPIIWHPWLEFNSDKKLIEAKLKCNPCAIEKVDVSKITSIKKESKDFSIKDAIVDCIVNIAVGVIGGFVLGSLFSFTFFGKLLLAVFFAFAGLICFITPAMYTIYTIKSDETENKEKPQTEEFEVFIENQNDIPIFEEFLKNCLESCGKSDLKIIEESATATLPQE